MNDSSFDNENFGFSQTYAAGENGEVFPCGGDNYLIFTKNYESGGAGLVSTLEDYSHFADMLLAGGTYEGRRILSPATVACMTQPQLKDAVRRDMWDSLDGYSYGHLMRICAEPGRIAGLACEGEYGWDGWLGTYFANFPEQQMTILSMQNTVDSGTTRVVRQMRNAVLAALSREN